MLQAVRTIYLVFKVTQSYSLYDGHDSSEVVAAYNDKTKAEAEAERKSAEDIGDSAAYVYHEVRPFVLYG